MQKKAIIHWSRAEWPWIFLAQSEQLQKFVEENGIYDLGVQRTALQYVNGWSLARYESPRESLQKQVEVKVFR
jgi:hypothetical protein